MDLNSNLVGYLVNLKIYGKNSGYVYVGNSRDEFPILSFSYDGTVFDKTQRDRVKEGTVGNIKKETLVDVGPGRFAIELEMQDGSKILKDPNNKEINIKENVSNKEQSAEHIQQAKAYWQSSGEIGTTSDGVTDVNPDNWESGYDKINKDYIYYVPDMNQWKYDTTNWTGCSPTAGSNVMAYWANKNSTYINLKPDSQSDIVFELRESMGTYQSSDGGGWTYIYKIDEGMQEYARNQGLSNATSTNFGNWFYQTSVSYSTFKNEISLMRPNLLTFNGQTYYGDHTVTGVGYKEYVYNGSSEGHQYMVIHDNWSSTTQTVYVAYGRNYDYVVMTQFKPAG